jgi:hypothetical protein
MSNTVILAIIWAIIALVTTGETVYQNIWQSKIINRQRDLIEKQLDVQNKAFKSSETLIRIMSDVDDRRNAKLNDKD